MMNGKPLAIDGFCGLGGATEGFLLEGWECVGFDIERHDYGAGGYPAQLVLQDILTIHGKQFAEAEFLWFSPPCQQFSCTGLPFKQFKGLIPSTALFDACFRIQQEASDAAGRHIPMIVENVRSAQKWVGRSMFHFNSFHLWGDIPCLMPHAQTDGRKLPGNNGPRLWKDRRVKRLRDSPLDVRSNFYGGAKSRARAASAQIAKIPLPLSRFIARHFMEQEKRRLAESS